MLVAICEASVITEAETQERQRLENHKEPEPKNENKNVPLRYCRILETNQ